MFKDYIRRVKRIVGDDQEKAKKIICGALVVISASTNDFSLNFYGIPIRRFQFITISAYQDFLLNKLQSFVKLLGIIVEDNLSMVMGCETAKAIWSSLEEQLLPNTIEKEVILKDSLATLKKGSLSIEVYVRKFKRSTDQS
ncbi:hypothetical protein Ddye_022756 [Dipteronia dyeriana]|uniref:Uncharacterized protein n=1 Tax=Dipteronia dyeriana TaxID=168575 RepID=A0AAD9TS80_9ROSI|nr:hypothetical protein Ddye_022756 [Dipteronia dyeriana]